MTFYRYNKPDVIDLVHKDRIMRQGARMFSTRVRHRVAFFEAACSYGWLRELNTVGDYAENILGLRTELSDRSLDWVFECEEESDATVDALLKRIDHDRSFANDVVAQLGPRQIASWRENQSRRQAQQFLCFA